MGGHSQRFITSCRIYNRSGDMVNIITINDNIRYFKGATKSRPLSMDFDRISRMPSPSIMVNFIISDFDVLG